MPKAEPNEWYSVRDSEIHGRGLYAKKKIPKDTWIVQYVGKLVSKEESDRLANELLDKAKKDGGAKVYMFILNDEWDIDGNVSWNTARLMNHSCEPNVEAQTYEEKEIWFAALRDIEKGEELTFNYGFDLENWEEHPCRCGKESCVGFIAAEEYWPGLRRKIGARKAWLTKHKKKQAAKKSAAAKKTPAKKSKPPVKARR